MAKLWSSWGFVAALVLAAVCWGCGAVMTRYALGAIPPLTLLVVQLSISVALLWIGMLTQGMRVRLNRNTVQLRLLGILNPGLLIQSLRVEPHHCQHVSAIVSG